MIVLFFIYREALCVANPCLDMSLGDEDAYLLISSSAPVASLLQDPIKLCHSVMDRFLVRIDNNDQRCTSFGCRFSVGRYLNRKLT